MPQGHRQRRRDRHRRASASGPRGPRCRCCCPTRRRANDGARLGADRVARGGPGGDGRVAAPAGRPRRRPGGTTDDRATPTATRRRGARARRAGPAGTIPLAVPNIGELERATCCEAVESGFVSSVGPFVARVRATLRRAGSASRHADRLLDAARPPCTSACSLLGVRAGRRGRLLRLHLRRLGQPDRLLRRAARARRLRARRRGTSTPPCSRPSSTAAPRRGETQPKVVEVVHVLGQPADMEPLIDACDRHGVPVLEDAAESLGADVVDRAATPAGTPAPSAASAASPSTATRSRRPAVAA